ncbi:MULTISPECIES: hypothetical protein [unclassified Nostoc]|uniref:hypothetical protein n=2 Tax=Nostoc TaxID=1177 RepID=UPI00260A94DC|nr:hypothetical protein [Nostoc sp. S13]
MHKFVKSLLRPIRDSFIFERFSAKLSQIEPIPSLYEDIFETRPFAIPKQCNLELHMLVCEKDFLRSFWSLKSFFHYSGLSARLVIQDDGTLTSESIARYYDHFPECIVNTHNDDKIREALTGYPMCQFFLGHHAIAKKLFHPLLLSQAKYVLIMDSDILWFKQSKDIINCVKKRLPFYVDGGCPGAYVRNQKFMEDKLGLYPADNVNSGIVGYQKSKFLDLEFIEAAMQKLVHIPKESILESVGYFDDSVDINSEDINQTLCWWVMEQTIYALLLGREMHRQSLKRWSSRSLDQLLGDLHQFSNSPIMRGTALIHYISDSAHNQFFPAGVQHLIKRRLLEKISNSHSDSPVKSN